MSTPTIDQSTSRDLMELVIIGRQRAPHLGSRLESAALIVRAGHVERTGDDTFRVRSSSGDRSYTVDLDAERPCDCPDCGSARVLLRERPTCKHALAGALLNALERRAAKRRWRQARLSTYRPAVTRRAARRVAA